jgi:molybdopterin synthase sulfur carrier subunit
MARVRLFAQAREAAGCREVEIEGVTVGEVVEELVRRFGQPLEDVIATSTIWLNGDVVAADHPAMATDEVAILPPVSGG